MTDFLTKVRDSLKTIGGYISDGVEAIAGFISRHPRKVAVVLVLYVSYRLFALVF